MKQYIVNVPESKTKIFLELLRNLGILKARELTEENRKSITDNDLNLKKAKDLKDYLVNTPDRIKLQFCPNYSRRDNLDLI